MHRQACTVKETALEVYQSAPEREIQSIIRICESKPSGLGTRDYERCKIVYDYIYRIDVAKHAGRENISVAR